MNALHNTLSHCVKCLKCLKGCPIDAIRFTDGKAVIQSELCIDCGRCMDICTHNGIFSLSSKLEDIEKYRYTCVLVPAAYYSQYQSTKEIKKSFRALQSLGFDEVVDLSPYGAGVMKATVEYINTHDETINISSHCPVVTRLIKQRYPSLLSSIVPINYASEIAAKLERQRIVNEQQISPEDIGIFLIAECTGKIGLAKYPLQRMKYEVDHAISLADLTPALRRAMGVLCDEEDDIALSKNGLLYALKDGVRRLLKDYSVINVDGIEKVINVLELAEFDQLDNIRFINMSSCYNGCVGGNFLGTNPFSGRIQMEALVDQAHSMEREFTFEDLFKEVKGLEQKDGRTMKEKIEWFKKVEVIVEKLPGIDCGACGYPSCRYLAEEIAKGNREYSSCLIRERGNV